MPCKNHPFVEDRLTRCSVCAEPFCPDCIVEIGGRPYCLSCKSEMMLGLVSGVPPGALDLASISRRFAALVIDGLVLSLPIFLLVFLAILAAGGVEAFGKRLDGSAGDTGIFMVFQGLATLVWMGVLVTYEGLMLSASGQTVGKKMLGIKVVTATGGDITRGQAWGRSAVRQAFGLVPCLGIIDYLVAFGNERTCIHDVLPKTRVVNWRG